MFAIHDRGTDAYDRALGALAHRGDADLERVEPAVREILRAVKERGDEAVLDLTERFEQRRPSAVVLPDAVWRAEAAKAPAEVREALGAAAERIRRYHLHQKEPGFVYEEDGVRLGQRVRPVKAAGVYAPGGKARYPSSVLMTAVPASVAGVPRIVLATPRPTAEVLAAAEIAGVTEVIDAGGAQAIGALAYGTRTVRRVDKIVGPGNIYVACAKRLVFGIVDIDGIAGPSEILVVADDEASPEVVAADLLSQAEHDEDAYALLVTLSRAQAEAVQAALERQLADLPRRAVAEASVRDNAAVLWWATSRRPRASRTPWPPSTSRSRSASRRRCSSTSGRRARRSSETTPPRRRATMRPGRATCCPPAAPRASRLRSACTTSSCGPR